MICQFCWRSSAQDWQDKLDWTEDWYGRPWTVETEQNIEHVAELIWSQEDNPRSPRKIENLREISFCSVRWASSVLTHAPAVWFWLWERTAEYYCFEDFTERIWVSDEKITWRTHGTFFTVGPHCLQCDRCINHGTVHPAVRLSICLSVTFWYCVETNEAMIMRFSLPASKIILVSGEVKIIGKFAGDHP